MDKTYRIIATKKNSGELIKGTTRWDGLSSLYVVTTDDNRVRYVSVLDSIQVFKEITT